MFLKKLNELNVSKKIKSLTISLMKVQVLLSMFQISLI